MKQLYEEELYIPIKTLFEKNGYVVRSEVNSCDITAIKDEELVVIELKKNLTIKLLTQAVERLKIADSVYLGVFKQKKSDIRKTFPLLRKLGLGLILVDNNKKNDNAEIILEPVPTGRKKTGIKRKRIVKEAQSRSIDYNIGGRARQKIVTAYKELSINIACYIEKNGPSSSSTMKKSGIKSDKINSILRNNFNGWFCREKHGIYGLTENGTKALNQYSDLSDIYRKLYDKID